MKKCPVCKDVTLVMADRQGIEIDYCPECRGVWLDRGELDKIIERTSGEPPQRESRTERPPERDDSSKHSDHSKQKKRKSILGDLLDF